MNHMLASDIGPAVLILFLAPIVLGATCLIVLAFKRSRDGAAGAAGGASAGGETSQEPLRGSMHGSSRGSRRGQARGRFGLILGLVPLIFGAFVLFFLLTVRGGAPRFFYIAAALPILVGIKILQIWRPDDVTRE
jgi:hypothetical protein